MSTVAAPRPPKPTRWEEPQGDRLARRERARALLARAGVIGALVASLAVVVTRQTVGYERQRELAAVQAKLSEVNAGIIDLSNEIQRLQTRARITQVAQQRLGMHVARDDEIVMLPIPASAAVSADPEETDASGAGGEP